MQKKNELFIKRFLDFFGEFLITSLKVRRKRISHYFVGVFKAWRNAFPFLNGPISLPDRTSAIDSWMPRSSTEIFLADSGPIIRFRGIFIRIKSFVVSTAGARILFIYNNITSIQIIMSRKADYAMTLEPVLRKKIVLFRAFLLWFNRTSFKVSFSDFSWGSALL